MVITLGGSWVHLQCNCNTAWMRPFYRPMYRYIYLPYKTHVGRYIQGGGGSIVCSFKPDQFQRTLQERGVGDQLGEECLLFTARATAATSKHLEFFRRQTTNKTSIILSHVHKPTMWRSPGDVHRQQQAAASTPLRHKLSYKFTLPDLPVATSDQHLNITPRSQSKKIKTATLPNEVIICQLDLGYRLAWPSKWIID